LVDVSESAGQDPDIKKPDPEKVPELEVIDESE
jgi:hypothetical protein